MTLNFPSYNFEIETENGQQFIFDPYRKKRVVLTPEEWVRQHVLAFLVQTHFYSKALIAVEREIVFNKLKKRFDAMVYDKTGKPFMLIECKAYDIALTPQTLQQIAVYNMNYQVPFLFVSNGMQHLLFEMNESRNYVPCKVFPKQP